MGVVVDPIMNICLPPRRTVGCRSAACQRNSNSNFCSNRRHHPHHLSSIRSLVCPRGRRTLRKHSGLRRHHAEPIASICPSQTLTCLDVDSRAQLRLAIAKILAALRLEEMGALQQELEEVCSRRVYEQGLDAIECVMDTAVRVRTSANPYGIHPVSKNTANNRRSTFRAICKEVTGAEVESVHAPFTTGLLTHSSTSTLQLPPSIILHSASFWEMYG